MKIEANKLNAFLGMIDLYISSSGFEDRSTAVGTILESQNIKNSIIFHLDDTYNISSDNIGKIKKNLPNLITEVYPKNSPLITFDKFYKTLEGFHEQFNGKSKINVAIDITTFTREILLILIKVLSLEVFIKCFNVTLIYTPAECYSTKNEHFWLTKGVREIRSVLGYSGMHSPSKQLLLVVLSGFEEERTNEIIQAFEPNKLILGKPSEQSSINEELNKISLEKYNYIREKSQSIMSDEFEFSCFEVLDTKDQINTIVEKYHEEYNIVIAPLNNKISTLGAALSGLENESVQICYASANQYNIESYSQKSEYFLIYNLNKLLDSESI